MSKIKQTHCCHLIDMLFDFFENKTDIELLHRMSSFCRLCNVIDMKLLICHCH